MSFFDDQTPVGRMNPVSVSGSKIGIPATVTGLSVAHKQIGPLIETTLTLSSVALPIDPSPGYTGLHLYTFPKGKLSIVGSTTVMTQTTTSELASTINLNAAGEFGVGTTVPDATTLATTAIDIAARKTFTPSQVKDEASASFTSGLDNVTADALDIFDGTTTAIEVFMNNSYTANLDGVATQTFSGTIEITWMFWAGPISMI